MDTDGIALQEMRGQVLRTVNRAVLAAGAAEGNLQVRKAPLEETLYMGIHQSVCLVQETENLPVFLQKTDHGLIQSCK